jgi:subtilase family serine protease
LKQVSVAKLAIGGSKSIKLSYSFNAGRNASGKYIIAVIDAYNAIIEADETNNAIASGQVP